MTKQRATYLRRFYKRARVRAYAAEIEARVAVEAATTAWWDVPLPAPPVDTSWISFEESRGFWRTLFGRRSESR